MIREVLRPKNTNITIKIPASYVGKKIEFILFPIDENETDTVSHGSRKSLRGVFNRYSNETKIDLENAAWQQHVIGKFSKDV